MEAMFQTWWRSVHK